MEPGNLPRYACMIYGIVGRNQPFFVRSAVENGEKFENFDFSLTEKQWNLLECETGQN